MKFLKGYDMSTKVEHFGGLYDLPESEIIGLCVICKQDIYDYEVMSCNICDNILHTECLEHCVVCGYIACPNCMMPDDYNDYFCGPECQEIIEGYNDEY